MEEMTREEMNRLHLTPLEDLLDEEYGPMGSPERMKFEAEAEAFCLAETLKEQRRLAGLTQQELADKIGTKKSYISKLENAADFPERGARCALCFAFSLERTARRASELGMHFATTLTVSPHKRSEVIFAAGARYEHFEAIDFKKKDGFLLSLRESARLGLYRQRFCGCEFSARASGEGASV